MALTLDQFVLQLTDSGLLTADEVTALVAGLPDEKKPADAEALAKQLVVAKRLTPFQAQQIWKGKGKSLTLGDYVISDKIGAGGMGMVFKAHCCNDLQRRPSRASCITRKTEIWPPGGYSSRCLGTLL